MNFGNSAYGIGQRRPVNNAPSFAPIRSGSGIGSGIDDNFRGIQSQSMNYGRADSFSRNNNNNSGSSYGNNNNSGSSYGNNNNSGSSYGNNNNSGSSYGNSNSQRFTSIDGKFGSMQSINYGRSLDNLGGGYSNQRFGGNPSNNRGVDSLNIATSKSNYNDNYRGQQQSSFMGRSMNNASDNNRAINNLDYSAGNRGSDNFRRPTAAPQQQQQQAQLSNLNLTRSVSDLGYNNDNNQRFYNNHNERIDTFRRADNFSDNYRGQVSNNLGRTGANFKFNNDGRSNNSPNFGYNNNSNINNNNRSFDDNFNNNKNIPNNLPQNYRGQQNDQALAVINDTVNALMTNSNYNFNNSANFNRNRNFNNTGPNPNNNWANNRPQQQQQAINSNLNHNNQGKVFKPPINRAQAPITSRKPAANFGKFQGNNRNQNQPINNNINPRTKPDQANNRRNNIVNSNVNPNVNKQQTSHQALAKNTNGGQKPQSLSQSQAKAVVAPKTAQNTQAKSNVNSKPEIKKQATDANPKVGQKRAAPAPSPAPSAVPAGAAGPQSATKADIKRRKLAIKRGFLLGGFKLPYVNSNKVALPQPEDKSYAVMFFEQALIYSTSGEELDDETTAEIIPDNDGEGKNAGRTLVKRIRKRLHYELTQLEESKKYKSWLSWWTDYKWCEKAIQKQLDTFGSVNLRDCFIPDLPRLTTEQVVDVIVKQAQFGLEKNSDNYFNNMKSILTLMNVTFLENLKMPNTEKVQDMIRAVPNDFWSYKMRSMVYLWAQYLKISKTSSPSTETGVKELQAIARDWKNPLFHWIAKQAFDELKAISEVEWPEHKQQYEELQSSEPTS
ncbi:GATA zinc finger domain-containing protein 14 [Drosophila innubila]|uniref:GATA zinc finger domain-containing protein 14 n=1 Tax=Drosophila innubila TaxID=198719 RepID=UPI00148E07A4|nr:GATA zinc finger domain-containing protein 14 [Drosophila innubila]